MIHKNRKSIRLKNYDYTRAGLYFVTICANHRQSIFGYIDDGVMMLNDAGRMIEKWYVELENKFEKIKCHQMVVMPNHIHCIIEIEGGHAKTETTIKNDTNPVGVDLCVYLHVAHKNDTNQNQIKSNDTNPVGVDLCVCPNIANRTVPKRNTTGRHAGLPLHEVIQWFKTMTTNEYIRGVKNSGWQSFDKKMWQRNYWEHIIRNEQSYIKLVEYIENNPLKWDMDSLHPDNAEVLYVK